MLNYNQVPKEAHQHHQYIVIKIKISKLVKKWESWGEIKLKDPRAPR
jgi:hypothetical protein